jgi:hypothetical protein
MLKLRPTLLLVLAVWLAMLGDSWGQSHRPSPTAGKAGNPPQTESTGGQQPTSANQRGTDDSPLVIKIIPPDSPQNKGTQEGAQQYKITSPEWLGVIFNGLLVLVVFLQFVWMIRQERWLKLTAQVAAVVERSYVNVDNFSLLAFDVNSTTATAYFQIWNSGRIPGVLTDVIFKYHIGLNIPPQPDYTNPFRGGLAVVRPTSFITQPVRLTQPVTLAQRAITQEEYDKIVSREWCVFVWGVISYTDAFKDIHKTAYCIKLVRQINGIFAPEIEGGPPYNYVT